ncbi:aminoacyl-tRNA hydrolase [archaeon]|nr:MAG: aminoacyl-tRNA hydrolase [archaeon]
MLYLNKLFLVLVIMLALFCHSMSLFPRRSAATTIPYIRLLAINDDYVPSIQAKDIVVPLDKVEFSFARSSGPGGQNVNKLNTKAELRFNVLAADWMVPEIKQRLLQYQANRVSKEGDLIITCQEHRTQSKNREDCLQRLREMLAEASIEPKEREMWEGIGDKGKAKRKELKQRRKSVKQNRRSSRDFD